MQIIVDNIDQFKAFFDVIYDMASDDVELQMHPNRMTCAMLDRTKTRFFNVDYESRFFDTYAVDDIESVTVSIEDIHNLLKLTNKTDVLYLEIEDPYLIAKVESKNGNVRVFEFVLPSESITSPTPPHAEFPSIFEVDASVLKQSVKDIKLIGTDLFKLSINRDVLTLTSDNDASTKYANTVEVLCEKQSDDVLTAGFTLQYIEQMLKFDKISSTPTLKFGDNYPLFYIFKDEAMGVTVTGMIAPRISTEEE